MHEHDREAYFTQPLQNLGALGGRFSNLSVKKAPHLAVLLAFSPALLRGLRVSVESVNAKSS